MVMGAPPPLLKVTVLAALVWGTGVNWVLSKLMLVGVKVAAATGVSARVVQGAVGPPTTPVPFSKMVSSVSAAGLRPSHTARDSAPTNVVPVVLVPPTARATSSALRLV